MSKLFDYEFYAKHFLKIITKKGTTEFLKFNSFQKETSDKIKEIKSQGKPVRIIILKARQLGISTFSTGYIFHQSATKFNQKSLVIADDLDNTNNLFGMCKRYYELLDPRVRPIKRYSNQKALVFDNPDDKTRGEIKGLSSSIHLQTAGKSTAGRSGTIQHLHCSEFPFWPNASEVVSGLFQSVPLGKNTTIIIEGTANGATGSPGEEFYNRWKRAESGESEFIPLFFPWFKNPEYQIPVSKDFTLNDDELETQSRFPEITKENFMFRRYKIENELGSSLFDPIDQFRQEYPTYADEAFIFSGKPVFNPETIFDRKNRIKDKPILCEFNSLGEIIEDKKGRFHVFSKPDPNKSYAVGADVAEGLETGDYSTMFVIDQDLNQCMSFKAHLDPDRLGVEMCKVGKYYNNAVLAPEVNNHGHATLAAIKNMEYPNIFTREIKEELSDKKTKKLGFQTNRKTKMHMLDEFVAAFRDDRISLQDARLLEEMSTLHIESTGDVELNGKDLVVSACIALQAIKQACDISLGVYFPGKKSDFKTLQDKLEYLNTKKKHETYF